MSERDITLAVSPATAWEALVARGPRRWYYNAEPRGEFTAGARIEWGQPDGRALEESEVVEVEPGRRLSLRTRYLFLPTLAGAPPVDVAWTVEPDAAGCRVTLAWAGEGANAHLVEEQAPVMLASLRLALDPAAQAEIARRPEIGPIEVRDVTPDRVADYQRFFDHDAFRDYPAWQECYCMEPVWSGSEEDYQQRRGVQNRADVSAMIERGEVTALLAYDGDRPVGWCQYGETTRLRNLVRRFQLDVAEHDGVGSLGCFVIAAPYRGHGVATALLEAALERMRRRGLRAAEAYPPRDQLTPQANYRGPLDMYLRAGFEPQREVGQHVVVRKALA